MHLGTEFAKLLIGWPVHRQVVEKTFHVREFLIKAFGLHQFRTAMPEFLGINTKRRKNHVVLHVGRTQRLIVVVDDGNSILERSHAASMDYALSRLRPVDENPTPRFSCGARRSACTWCQPTPLNSLNS